MKKGKRISLTFSVATLKRSYRRGPQKFARTFGERRNRRKSKQDSHRCLIAKFVVFRRGADGRTRPRSGE